MKFIFTLLFSVIFTFGFSESEVKAYQLFNSKGKEISYQKLLKALDGKKYIFFGEYHDNPMAHWLQFELTKSMHSMYRNRLVLGAEMFEADNQYILNEYLNDYISEKNYQNEMRLWSNYNTDYKPLVEYAKANQLPFIATNIPRRYANMVYKKGLQSLNNLSDLAKSFIVPLTEFKMDTSVNCYKTLIEQMGGHGGLEMATAQAIKDATMAYFILKNMEKNSVFLHYNGSYHSNNHEGIVYYLTQNGVKLDDVLTITTVTQENVSEIDEDTQNLADFILCVNENMTRTH